MGLSMPPNQALHRTLDSAGERRRSGGHAARVRQNAALTSFAAWFGNALRAAEPGCFTCRGGRQAFGSPSPAQVSAALGSVQHTVTRHWASPRESAEFPTG